MTSTYAHHLPYTKASDLAPTLLPHLGTPAARIAQAFLDAYQATVALFRSPTFHDNLSHLLTTSPATLSPYLTAQLDAADHRFSGVLTGELARAHAAGAALGRRQVSRTPLQKAGQPPGSSPRPIAAIPTQGLSPAQIAAQTPSLPPPVFPFLRIPRYPSSIRIRRAPRVGRGQAPLTHIDAARNLALDLVVQINADQRDLIGQYVTEAVTRGVPVTDTGLRIANVVGLFPRWANAVNKYHQGMLDNQVNARIAQRNADTYADRLRVARGKMIARTELLRALNIGRINSWHGMADDGIIDPDNSVKEWLAAPGACPICEELSGTRVQGIDTTFDTPKGEVSHPPLHPNCRCTTILRPAVNYPPEPSSRDLSDEAVLSDPELQHLIARG